MMAWVVTYMMYLYVCNDVPTLVRDGYMMYVCMMV